MPSIDAICFDLDDTLCVPEWSDHEFHNKVFERTNIDPKFSPRDLRAIDPDEIEPAENITEFYTNLYRATIRNIDTEINPDSPLIEELGKQAGDLYDPTAVKFREGAKELLEYVGEHYQIGLITNGKRETQRTKLQKLGLTERFDTTVICGPSQGIDGKPALEPFEMALADLSTSADKTIHVGDSHGEDIIGANKAGIKSVWVPMNRSHEEVTSEPDPAPTYRVKSLTELHTII